MSFRHVTHHHHLPRIQTRARGGYFIGFDNFNRPATTTTSLASKRELEVVLLSVSTDLPPPPPPPSHPNVSWRWFPRLFRHAGHHLLPEVAHSPYPPPPHVLISTNASENNPEVVTPYVAISSSHFHANASENDPEAVTPYAAISPSHLIGNALESDQEAALTCMPPHPPISCEYPLGCSTRIFFFLLYTTSSL